MRKRILFIILFVAAVAAGTAFLISVDRSDVGRVESPQFQGGSFRVELVP